MAGPLQGFRIIDVCRAGPGQWATALLADYGADVITIVEPGHAQRRAAGGAQTPESGTVNRRNKRSILLNIRASQGLEVFHRLARDADGLLESNRPGVAKRLQIDYETLSAVNPSIVYCSLSGFGQDGPYAAIAAHDLTYQGVAGMIPLDEEGTPRMPPYNQADINASYFGAMALLMGLLRRSKTGRGEYLDVAFTDVSVTIPPGRMADEGLRGHYPAYQIYRCKDGRYLTLSTREPWFWERVCKLVGREEWIPHIRPQGKLREEMFAFFREFFARKTLAEWMPVLRERDVQFGPVNTSVDELRADPHLQARQMALEVMHPLTGEKHYEPGFAMKFAASKPELRRGPMPMGADTDAILRELGYDEAQVAGLRQAAVVE